jgi:methyltransferase (TIGR00027 family)
MRRKREIDRLVRQAATDGFKQLVVLGTGLDALAFRIHQEQLYGTILAADHPATLRAIRSALSQAGTSASCFTNGSSAHPLELVELDFNRDDVSNVLLAVQVFNQNQPTVVVIEGVLMYLAVQAVRQALRSITSLLNPTIRLIGSAMIAEPGQPIGFHRQSSLVKTWLNRQSEPMLWATTWPDLPMFLAQLGWGEVGIIDLSTGAPGAHKSHRGLRSEVLFVAGRRA